MLAKTKNRRNKRRNKKKGGVFVAPAYPVPPKALVVMKPNKKRRRNRGNGRQRSVPLVKSHNTRPTKNMMINFSQRGDSCICRGQDYLTTVSVDTVVGTVAYQTAVSPGVFSGSRLYHFAKLYERWRALKIKFHYIPACAATTIGSFVGYVDYDVNDEVTTPIDFKIAFAHKGAKGTNLWTSQVWDFNDNADKRQMTDLYTSIDMTSDLTNNSNDLKFFAPCRFVLATHVGGAADAVVGSLYMEYEIEFYIPQIQPDPDSFMAFSNFGFTTFTGENELLVVMGAASSTGFLANPLVVCQSPFNGGSLFNPCRIHSARQGDKLMFLAGWTEAAPSGDRILVTTTNGDLNINFINQVMGVESIFHRYVAEVVHDSPTFAWTGGPVNTALDDFSFEIHRISDHAYQIWNQGWLNGKKRVKTTVKDRTLTGDGTLDKRRSKNLIEQLCDCSPLSEHDGSCPTLVRPYYSKYVQDKMDKGKSSDSFIEYAQKWKNPLFRANQIAKFNLGGITELKLKSQV